VSIKFIVADLDGTLLNSHKHFSPNLFPVIRKLREHGIFFSPASGRQFYNLREMFEPVADELFYISENGSMVCKGNEILSFENMSLDVACRTIEICRELCGVSAIVSCRDYAFYENDQDEVFLENMALYYARRAYVSDLIEIIRSKDVCKIALFGQKLAENHILPALYELKENAQVALSGEDWVDIMSPGINKGMAVTALRDKLGLAVEECMAFGDYLNDMELLGAVGESYAMANAHPTLKAAAKHICPSNDDDGVCQTICRLLHI